MSVSSSTATGTTTGLIFPKKSDDGYTDAMSVGMPIVHRYLHDEGYRWKLWYHGRDEEFGKDDGLIDIGTGRIFTAESANGLVWERVEGQGSGKSVISENSEAWWGFDSAHIGLGDVTLFNSDRIQKEGGMYFMYYFGGTFDETDVTKFGLPSKPTGSKGIRMKIGAAISQDGINWSRIEGEHADGSCVDCGQKGDFDELFCGWPTVFNYRQKEFRMYYHSLSVATKKWSIGLATGQDGLKWIKHSKNPVFEGGPTGAWDEKGASRRCILKRKNNDEETMIYEGIDANGIHAIGVATSKDGITWVRQSVDKPAFERNLEPGAWDGGGVTSPYVVDMDEGRYWMFYVGYPEGKDGQGRIGVAEALNGDLSQWKRIKSDIPSFY